MLSCAGILLYQNKEVFLTHPGGPFFSKKDNVWGIPKGIVEKNEALEQAARREFQEETGMIPPSSGMTPLGSVKYNNKEVHGFAVEFKSVINPTIKSNITKFGWPEIDKAQFFPVDIAFSKILPAQKPFLERLSSLI